MVQWLRLRAPNAGSLGSIPGQGTRSHMLQLRICMLRLKIPHALRPGVAKYFLKTQIMVSPKPHTYMPGQEGRYGATQGVLPFHKRFRLKELEKNRCWQGCGETGTLVYYQWGRKAVQPLWKTVWGSKNRMTTFHFWVYTQKNWKQGLKQISYT